MNITYIPGKYLLFKTGELSTALPDWFCQKQPKDFQKGPILKFHSEFYEKLCSQKEPRFWRKKAKSGNGGPMFPSFPQPRSRLLSTVVPSFASKGKEEPPASLLVWQSCRGTGVVPYKSRRRFVKKRHNYENPPRPVTFWSTTSCCSPLFAMRSAQPTLRSNESMESRL